MKRIILKAVWLAAAVAGMYLLVFSLKRVHPGSICAVEDLRTGKVVKTAAPFAAGFVFVWEGSLPWWYVMYEMPIRRSASFTVSVSLPGLEGLKEEYYHVGIPIRVRYRIDTKRFAEPGRLARGGKDLDAMVSSLYKEKIAALAAPLLSPVYQRELLAAKVGEIVDTATKSVAAESSPIGIIIENANLAGCAFLPERVVVNEGMIHAADLRRMDKSLQMDLIGAKAKVERERVRNEQLYAKLREMSRIIRGNPDILKYIYIDKIADDVKVIISSDASGVPRMIERELEPTPAKKTKPREINNLR